MCFVVSDKYPNKLIAKKDIRCYKRMEKIGGQIYSAIKHKKYSFGKLTKAKGTRHNAVLEISWVVFIQTGTHSYVAKSLAKYYQSPDEILVQCTIPKGSRYYKNETEYVSNRIIIVKEVK